MAMNLTAHFEAHCPNITKHIESVVQEMYANQEKHNKPPYNDDYYDDSGNSYKYIVFVLGKPHA